ncbi:MAG TPA: class I SAM-dependent methyltransferase [Candidatus Binatia bacterium]|jgi:ubiquinone/menaquinone biosynthesis C-methylase UbiE|nr:class I SAM-dependent methyltransferase [Candidatus Binatia bacterium]
MPSLYERYLLPRILDFAMRQKPIMRQRDKVVPLARGRVLEIGMGSGLNLAYYDRGKLEKLWGLEPSPELRAVAERRAREAGVSVEFVGLTGESIPLDDASVDTVVTTYTLCTIPDAERALLEMRRVLRPAGQLLFSEHGLAPDAPVARWQDRLNPLWRRIAGGCNLNRPIDELVRGAGFAIDPIDTMYLPGPRPFTFNYWGTATRA